MDSKPNVTDEFVELTGKRKQEINSKLQRDQGSGKARNKN